MGKKGKTSYSPKLRHMMRLDAEAKTAKKKRLQKKAKSVRDLLKSK